MSLRRWSSCVISDFETVLLICWCSSQECVTHTELYDDMSITSLWHSQISLHTDVSWKIRDTALTAHTHHRFPLKPKVTGRWHWTTTEAGRWESFSDDTWSNDTDSNPKQTDLHKQRAPEQNYNLYLKCQGRRAPGLGLHWPRVPGAAAHAGAPHGLHGHQEQPGDDGDDGRARRQHQPEEGRGHPPPAPGGQSCREGAPPRWDTPAMGQTHIRHGGDTSQCRSCVYLNVKQNFSGWAATGRFKVKPHLGRLAAK